ncbi:MAG: hypothetical protein AAF634_03515 [Bacteroidota bacterium]
MKKMLILISLLTACSYAQTHTNLDKAIASALSENYRIAVIKKDTMALLNMLHPEVVFSPPTGQTLNGSENVGPIIKSFLAKNDVTFWQVEILETWEKGTLIFEFGEFEIKENAAKMVKRKYLNIWELHKNKYKLSYRGWSPI